MRLTRRCVLLSALLALGFGCGRRTGQEQAPSPAPPTPTASIPEAESTRELSPEETLEAAIQSTEEARTSNDVRRAPRELLHYADRKRFLAIQVAASNTSGHERPHDLASLARMIRSGQLEGVPMLGPHHVLDGVGVDAHEDPFTHYDLGSDLSIPLLARTAAAEKAAATLAGSSKMRDQVRGRLISKLYGEATSRAHLLAEHTAMTELARDFEGDSYDLADEDDREHLQSRMLSYVRPPTRDVLLTLAKSYHERFGRLLPVVSLIRTERYQRSLSEVNANATKVMVAPHTTGQAFDITYRYMANDEQNFLMDEIAKLEAAGRVEALRENRNCFHVFVFASGKRPGETAIAAAKAEILAGQEEAEPPKPVKRKLKPRKRTARRR